MKKILTLSIMLWASVAHAQFTPGQLLTAAELNNQFALYLPLTGVNPLFASPPSIGSVAANTGAFTALSASSTVSGTGFSNYLASPPPIGSTISNLGTFSGVQPNGSGTLSATPIGNPFVAYSNFVDNYTASKTALPEWAAQINMTSSLGNGQGTPNGDKVAFFTGMNQLAGSGPAWGGNTVVQSASSGVGSNGLIGYEIDGNFNNPSIPGSTVPTSPNYTAGLAFSGAGTVAAEAAIFVSGPSQNWYRGIYFDGQASGAIAGNSIEDASQAPNSYLLRGTHTYGIKGDGGTFSSGFMTIPNGSNIQWKNSGGTLSNGISLDASNNLQMGYGGMGNIIENGSTVPVTNNALTLGTAALQWSTIYGVAFTATGLITPSSTVGIKGTTAADNAQAGSDGEFASNSTTGTSLTTATTANCTSVSLTAGDWDVTGLVRFNPAGTTTIGFEYAGISTTSATLGALGSFVFSQATKAAGSQDYTQVPVVRVNVSATTTVYAVAQASFGTSTMTCDGFIRARRVR